MPAPVTLQDVAAAAGVSAKTVSRVVNGDRHVSVETRTRIERAVARLGYRPNLAARSLVTARSYMVGVISPHLRGFFYSELHAAALTAAKAGGYHLLIEEHDPYRGDDLKQLEASLRQMRLEGVVLTPPLSDDKPLLDSLDKLGLRCVRISPALDLARTDAVSANQQQGMAELAAHLVAQGHQCFGIIASPAAMLSERRHIWLTEALVQHGVRPERIIVTPLDWDRPVVTEVRHAAAHFFSADPRPTAIFAANDRVAMPIIQYAFEQGLRVPEDLSVTGCDDIDIAEAVWPPLTTVRQPIGQMATEAIRLLLAPRANATRHLTLAMPLVIRGSSGLAPR